MFLTVQATPSMQIIGGKLLKSAFLLCLALVLSLSITVQAHAEPGGPGSYYVSTQGNNANPGTFDQPWKTVQHAIDAVHPGDVIYLHGGVYSESVGVHQSGRSDSPITLTSYSGERATIDGGANMALYDAGSHEYITLRSLTLKSTGRFTLRIGWWQEPKSSNYWTVQDSTLIGATILRGHHNLFDNNIIDGSGYTQDGAGIQDIQEVSHDNIFRGNTIRNFTTNDGRGIWLESRSHDDLVENNVISNISGRMGQCIDVDDYGEVGWRHTIRNNRVSGCGYVGIQIENGFDTLIENNTLSGGGQAGIIIINYGDGKCKMGGDKNQYGDLNGDGDCRGNDTGNLIRQNLVLNAA
ncbi:MAG: right-handed parallel beta-helix repeat-containing protein, partial [Anaerolineaceae bacterium]|nr:right-handed parallel beta-helix repeat-containing protein [Anaerolineaceae bacterium]